MNQQDPLTRLWSFVFYFVGALAILDGLFTLGRLAASEGGIGDAIRSIVGMAYLGAGFLMIALGVGVRTLGKILMAIEGQRSESSVEVSPTPQTAAHIAPTKNQKPEVTGTRQTVWRCKKCGASNPSTKIQCKACAEYR